MKRKFYIIAMAALSLQLASMPCDARRKGYTLKVDTKKGSSREALASGAGDDAEEEMARGSFMVASQCEDCNNGYRLEQVRFSGYDKPRTSAVETFFITNNTDRMLTGISLYIDYRMPDGRQLHKRYYSLRCAVPPGETRMAEIPSWDRQKSFVYERSADSPKRPGTPFTVTFDPVAYYLSW
ncbi:MAG: hypothetical protein K2N88_03300 [Muribaculaceae bacterium]|nr:hypothetical protein [Muribaculaceae bacterium]